MNSKNVRSGVELLECGFRVIFSFDSYGFFWMHGVIPKDECIFFYFLPIKLILFKN